MCPPQKTKWKNESEKEVLGAFYKTSFYKKWFLRETKKIQKRPDFKKSLKDLKKSTIEKSLEGAERAQLIKKWIDFCNEWHVNIKGGKICPRLPVESPVQFKVVDGRYFPDPDKKGTIIFKRAVSRTEYDAFWPLIRYYLKEDFGSGVNPWPKRAEKRNRRIYEDYLKRHNVKESPGKIYESLAQSNSLSTSTIEHIISKCRCLEKKILAATRAATEGRCTDPKENNVDREKIGRGTYLKFKPPCSSC
ncbi:MAG: hypothetical protein HZA28_05175 [Candidatus Omnitrophica bacterium]|nr:hypothetical protein [Candidatus Omnitrophota bacterium]